MWHLIFIYIYSCAYAWIWDWVYMSFSMCVKLMVCKYIDFSSKYDGLTWINPGLSRLVFLLNGYDLWINSDVCRSSQRHYDVQFLISCLSPPCVTHKGRWFTLTSAGNLAQDTGWQEQLCCHFTGNISFSRASNEFVWVPHCVQLHCYKRIIVERHNG